MKAYNIILNGEVIESLIGYDFDAEHKVNYQKEFYDDDMGIDCHFEETNEVSIDVYSKIDYQHPELIEEIVKLSKKLKHLVFLYPDNLELWCENEENVKLTKITEIEILDDNPLCIYFNYGDRNFEILNDIQDHEQLEAIKEIFKREVECL